MTRIDKDYPTKYLK